MKDKMSKITKGVMLSTALYSSMSFAYRLDKNIELSYVNYSFISDALIDILNNKDCYIKFECENFNNLNEKNDYFSTTKDETVVVYNNKNSSVENVRISKKGNSNSIYNSGVLGNNSAILSESNIEIKNGTIKTFGLGAKGFYQKGKGNNAIMENFIIETMQKNSNAIESSEESNIKIYNVYIYTSDDCSGGLCVSANGKINANKVTIYTVGEYSPGMYVNGVLTLKESLIETSSSYLAVLEGESCFISINSSLRGYKGIKVSNNESDGKIKSKIGIIGRYLNVNKGWALICENSNVDINLLNTNITSKEKKILNLKTYSEEKNNSTITLKNSFIEGEIKTDNNNFLKIIMNDKSYISGIINGNVDMNFNGSKYSLFNMKGDSYISKIEISKKNNNVIELMKFISLNGFTLHYNSKENSWLENKTYYFEDGSVIKPNEII